MSSVILKNIKKTFDNKTCIIKGLSLEMPDNELTVFVGPSGCGKSTLLRLIAGLEDVTDGDIFIDTENVTDLPPAKRGISMVFQSYALYPHMTVYDNIEFGLKKRKETKEKIRERVLEAAKILHVEHLLERFPRQLSGGQRQRVAIGRAIVRNPKVFLFDEPLSNLDASLRVEMRMQIARLKRKLKTTMIYVTHDQVEAMTLADKIVVLRNGTVEQMGTPLDLYKRPCNLFVASFLGSPTMNFIDVSAKQITDIGVVLTLPQSKEIALPFGVPKSWETQYGRRLVLGIRPEHLVECTAEEAFLEGKVRLIEHLGSETYVYVRIEHDVSVLVRASGDHEVAIGDRLYFKTKEKHCYLFDKKTERALPACTT